MNDLRKQNWPNKFRAAGTGIRHAFRGQSSFYIHLPCAAAVIGLGFLVKLDLTSWCLLVLCIGMVLAAELFNTSLEILARAITEEKNEHVGLALDTASGAVLVTSVFAMIVGIAVFLPAMTKFFTSL